MKTSVILDFHLATGRVGYLVRALLKFEGDAQETDAKAPLNLSLVLDRSGSMSGEKLRYARNAAAFLVRRLRPEDVVSVVAYDTTVTTVAEPATGSQQASLPAEIEPVTLVPIGFPADSPPPRRMCPVEEMILFE